ncbi:hypothetical protein DFQ04_2195 [Algoriphagus boseongensis]|uniref:DUF5683 domain-containing protein n=1 Tax=Algoriphagus boseongensis TaxID=1442587 RepID=A0A4R6T4V4_9BACT|nr:hypothetical protein [Algoriphagus boseongensis]TDQ17541.1 hypothetical protein DFQ04_2195 [Algoriphagus boseongensis]
MENKFLRSILVLFFLAPMNVAFAQTTPNSPSYFSGSYSQQPIISFKEGFFNKTTYFLDGEKSSPKQVAALLNSVQNEDFKFEGYQRKKNWGNGIRLSGIAITIGSIAYLFTNEITPANVRPWFCASFGGGVLQSTGNILVGDSERRIQSTINDFNAYHYSGGEEVFLSMDESAGFFGSKIDIYEGPMKLDKSQVMSRMQSKPEVRELYDKIFSRQKVSTVAQVANTAVQFGIIFFALASEPQSSALNKTLIPLTMTGIGLNIFSGAYDRKTRNLTREALLLYNYE